MARYHKALTHGDNLPAPGNTNRVNPGPAPLPQPKPWESGTLQLQQLAQRIETDYFDFCDLARRALKEDWWAHFGYPGPQPYFEARVGISYRSVRRRLALVKAIERLPEAERPQARVALASIGGHKASVLAPLLGQSPDWQDFVELAMGSTEEALQDAVSAKLGLKSRGKTGEPGDTFLRLILRQVPPDEVELVEAVFDALRRHFDLKNAVAGFLVMVALTARDLRDQGISVDINVEERITAQS